MLSLHLALFAFLTTPPASAGVRVDSPHFTIVAETSESDALSLASDLETIRLLFVDALPRAFGGGDIDPPEPIVVYAVADSAGIARLTPTIQEDDNHRRPYSIFRSGTAKHFLVVQMDASQRVLGNAFHEYSHLMARVHWGRLPLWLDEGLAAFWEGSKLDEDSVDIGVAQHAYLETLALRRALPLLDLLSVSRDSPHYRREDEAALFYAQSWLLVHYLLIGDETYQRRRELFDYIARLSTGEDASDALAAAFGDLNALASNVARYATQSQLRFVRRPKPPSVSATSLSTRVLSEGEMEAHIGDFIVHGGAPERAEDSLARALELEPNFPLVHEGLGYLALSRERRAEALEAFSRAVQLGSENFLTLYYHALSLGAARAPTSAIEESLNRSLTANPSFPDAHFTLGRLRFMSGDRGSARSSFRRALSLPLNDARIPAEIGRMWSEQASPSEAVHAYERAVEVEPANGELHYQLGKALDTAGRAKEAAEHFSKARELGYVP